MEEEVSTNTRAGPPPPPPPRFICLEKERTYCFATVGDEARRLLEGFLQVVFESLVLVLLGSQLHEFPWKHNTDGWKHKFQRPPPPAPRGSW